jgi:hypothetical protein
MKRRALVIPAAATAVLAAGVGPAAAAWNSSGAGSGATRAGQLQPPTAAGVAFSSASARLVWKAPGGAPAPGGYVVTRNGATVCVTTKTSCLEMNLAPGSTYTYLVSSTSGRYWVSATPLTMTATTAPGSFTISDVSTSAVTAGAKLTFTVSATYGFGSVDTSYTGVHPITITSSLPASPGGNVSGGDVRPTFTAGVAGMVATTVYAAGTQTLTVSDGARTGTLAISVSPAAASSLELLSATSTDVLCAPSGEATVPAGQALTARVALVDAYGNLVIAGTAMNLALTYSGAGELTPTTLTIPAKTSQTDSSLALTKSAGASPAGTLTITAAGTTVSARCTIN